MFDAKKLLDQFLGSQMPGASGSVGQKGNDILGMAKANPWKSGALAAVLLGTKTGRSLGGNALKLGGLAVMFTAIHLAALVADSYVHFGLADLTVPFASSWQPGAVALGVVAMWLLLAVEVIPDIFRTVGNVTADLAAGRFDGARVLIGLVGLRKILGNSEKSAYVIGGLAMLFTPLGVWVALGGGGLQARWIAQERQSLACLPQVAAPAASLLGDMAIAPA